MSDNWDYKCLDCGGKGYQEKLSCGCTGYGMRRPCMACKGKGTVTVKMHETQAETQRKFWEEKYKVI